MQLLSATYRFYNILLCCRRDGDRDGGIDQCIPRRRRFCEPRKAMLLGKPKLVCRCHSGVKGEHWTVSKATEKEPKSLLLRNAYFTRLSRDSAGVVSEITFATSGLVEVDAGLGMHLQKISEQFLTSH